LAYFSQLSNIIEPLIISLNETKLNLITANKILFFPEYEVVHKARGLFNGAGGVALLVLKSLPFKVINDFEDLGLELLAIAIKYHQRELIVLTYYNPPDAKLCFEVFRRLSARYKYFLVLGDLNAKSKFLNSQVTNNNGDALDEIILQTNSIILNNKDYTHFSFSGISESILDLAIGSSDFFDIFDEYKVLREWEMHSDHVPISVTLKDTQVLNASENRNQMANACKFNFKKAKWNVFREYLPTIIPPEIADNVESLNEFVTSSLYKAALQSIPQIKSKKGEKTLPECIFRIVKLRKKLQYSRAKLKKKKKSLLVISHRINKLTNLMRLNMEKLNNQNWNFFMEKFKNNPLNSKSVWDKINFIRRKKDSKDSIGVFKVGDKANASDEGRALIFVERLSATFTESAANQFNQSFKIQIDEFIQNFTFQTNDFMEKFTIADLNEVIDNLQERKAAGMDLIHNRMLKESHHQFRLILLHLFNTSTALSTLPKSWKSSCITMIPKKINRSSDPKDYRPISLTSNLAKLADRLVLKRLQCFLNTKNIILKQQSGFRAARQTKDNILFLSQKIAETLVRKKKVCCVFFDIAAAFDKVWHNGLLFKLIQIQTPNYITAWIREFLNKRQFLVKLNNFLSNANTIETGVPQGAVLSPILFSIFINDIPIAQSKNRRYSLLFADDLVSLFIFKRRGKIQIEIQRYLSLIEKWLMTWRLMMAPNKCSHNTFSNANTDESHLISIKLFDEFIPIVSNPRFLGVTFDTRLTFKHQIEHVQKSCMSRLNIIKILSSKSWHLSQATLVNIYKSIVRSIMEYSSIIFHSIAVTNFHKLEVIQNNAIRSIFKLPYLTNQETLLSISHIEGLKERFHNLNHKYLTNCIKTKNPLIMDLMDEFKQFHPRPSSNNTPLSPFINIFMTTNVV